MQKVVVQFAVLKIVLSGPYRSNGYSMNCRYQSGFTFLEVMVAVMIIAIAFVTLIGSQSQSVSVAGDSRFNVIAALLAQEKLTEIESAGFDDVFSGQGDFGEDYPSYRWKSEVADLTEDDTSIPGGNDMLKRVDVIITLGEDESRSYAVRSIVMRRTGGGGT